MGALEIVGKAYRGANITVKIISILSVVAALGTAAFYVNGVQNIRAENVQLEGFQNVRADGFDAVVSADVVNPSQLEVPVDSIRYRVVLQDTGALLSEGVQRGVNIAAEDTTHLEVKPRIKWVGGAASVAQYLLQDEVLADVEVSVQVLPFIPSVQFTETIDIKPALEQMQEEIIENPAGNAGDIVENPPVDDGLLGDIFP